MYINPINRPDSAPQRTSTRRSAKTDSNNDFDQVLEAVVVDAVDTTNPDGKKRESTFKQKNHQNKNQKPENDPTKNTTNGTLDITV